MLSRVGSVQLDHRRRPGRAPTLTREQELSLATRWRELGDAAAAEALVRAHLGLVVTVAGKYRRYPVQWEELVAEGNLGVVRALQKFDPERGPRFATYAVHWIRCHILGYVIRSWSLVGGGSGPLRSKLFFKLRRERARAVNSLGEGEAADALVAERLGLTTGKLAAMTQRLEGRDISLDAPLAANSRTLVDVLSTPATQELELSHVQTEHSMLEAVRKAVSGLDPRERYVVEQRLMADSAEALSLAEIGRRLGVSRERARQLEQRAKLKLRKRIPACGNSLFNEWLRDLAVPGALAKPAA